MLMIARMSLRNSTPSPTSTIRRRTACKGIKLLAKVGLVEPVAPAVQNDEEPQRDAKAVEPVKKGPR